ncbi:MAG TPA: thiamine pyrophosphate-requiring protein, partial [Thermomicrobiales bacterium]|nr:thiamine pyrophosphate-requiring protein [Thermomicrobiales bacterium]
VRHEESAALMASGHARFTGEVGVCLATQGPGAIHLLNGLYDARLDHQPVVAIVGQVSQMAKGSHFQQEVDLSTLFKDVAGAFVEVATKAEQVEHLVDRAMRIAMAERTVTCVIVPHDLQNEPAVEEPPREHGAMHSAGGYVAPRIIPTDAELQRAADVLNAGKRVAILAGAGAMGATNEVIAVADALGAGIAKALLGKAAVPDTLPFVTGATGWLGTTPSNRMLAECDTLLMVGSGFPYTEFLPRVGQARGVQIDRNPGALSMRYPMEVGLTGDSAEALRALLPLLQPAQDRGWRRWIEEQVSDWHAELARRAAQPANPVNPQLHFQALSPRLPDNAMLAADSGSSTVWYARNLLVREGMKASVSGTLATMGCAIPYALAAKLAFPDRVAFAFLGDGAMQMNGLAELVTVAESWPLWSDPRFVIHVLNNRDLSFVTWEQRAMEGSPRFPVSQAVPEFPYARYAELLGLKGIRVDDPTQVEAAWDEALGADRPVLIEAITDPDMPTLPPEPEPEVMDLVDEALAHEPGADHVRRLLAGETSPLRSSG